MYKNTEYPTTNEKPF